MVFLNYGLEDRLAFLNVMVAELEDLAFLNVMVLEDTPFSLCSGLRVNTFSFVGDFNSRILAKVCRRPQQKKTGYLNVYVCRDSKFKAFTTLW